MSCFGSHWHWCCSALLWSISMLGTLPWLARLAHSLVNFLCPLFVRGWWGHSGCPELRGGIRRYRGLRTWILLLLVWTFLAFPFNSTTEIWACRPHYNSPNLRGNVEREGLTLQFSLLRTWPRLSLSRLACCRFVPSHQSPSSYQLDFQPDHSFTQKRKVTAHFANNWSGYNWTVIS